MAVWGLSPVFIRSLAVELGPPDALVIRYGAVALIFAAALTLKGSWQCARADWQRLIVASLVGMLGYNVASVYGFELLPASIGGLIVGTQPLLIVMLAALIGREPLTMAAITGIIVASFGTVMLFWNDLSLSSDSTTLLKGGFLIFVSGAAWAFYAVSAKPLIVKYGPLSVSALSIIIAAVPMLILFPSFETFAVMRAMTTAQWGEMAFLIIVATFISSITWNYGVGRLSSAAAGAFLYLVPVLAVAAGVIFLDEALSANIILGGTLILAGVAIAQFGGRRRMARLQKR
jgi:drug/metabolite transporter (DMT)-like permease